MENNRKLEAEEHFDFSLGLLMLVRNTCKTVSFIHRFEEGAEQFRLDVAQNPNDTEESIWCFLCEAQLYGVDEARQRFLEVIQSNVTKRALSLDELAITFQ